MPRVNGTVIGEAAVAREIQYHPAPSLARARQEAVRALVVRELLLQRAAACGIVEPDPPTGDSAEAVRETREEGLIRTLLARELALPEPDAATCRRYYDNNRRRFCSADLFQAAHILFAAAPDDAAARTSARQRAEAALAALRRAPQRFAELARELSDCPSGKQGGSLGQVTRGQTVPEFETFLLGLEEGQICPAPAPTRYGFHVIRLDRRVAGRELPFELVQERIAEYLRARVWRRAVAQYIQLLVGDAELEDVDLNGAATPLVQ